MEKYTGVSNKTTSLNKRNENPPINTAGIVRNRYGKIELEDEIRFYQLLDIWVKGKTIAGNNMRKPQIKEEDAFLPYAELTHCSVWISILSQEIL